ncbi:hypothetical protein GCM10009745_36740 [Kribbella yunnanensis]|uniref:Uncharacterized protein n=1 Tax=Kribbella yunnanensis TaxID=190194 RepID=A0ABP4TJ51_9ACTN
MTGGYTKWDLVHKEKATHLWVRGADVGLPELEWWECVARNRLPAAISAHSQSPGTVASVAVRRLGCGKRWVVGGCAGGWWGGGLVEWRDG